MRLGLKKGKPIRVDEATSSISRGHYARICVEVDLSKPLLSKFKLWRIIRRLKYKGIHLACFDYGLYGHRLDTCPHDVGESKPACKAQRTKKKYRANPSDGSP